MFPARFRFRHIFILLFLFVIATVAIDLVRISRYQVIPMRPSEGIELQQDEIYYELTNGVNDIDWKRLDGTLEYVSAEYDCSDFRLVNLVQDPLRFWR